MFLYKKKNCLPVCKIQRRLLTTVVLRQISVIDKVCKTSLLFKLTLKRNKNGNSALPISKFHFAHFRGLTKFKKPIILLGFRFGKCWQELCKFFSLFFEN